MAHIDAKTLVVFSEHFFALSALLKGPLSLIEREADSAMLRQHEARASLWTRVLQADHTVVRFGLLLP